jgi:hypothetical protein
MIHEGIPNIDRWITEKLDAPDEIYRPSTLKRKIDLYALDHFQQVGKREDKEVTKSMVICSKIHKVAR